MFCAVHSGSSTLRYISSDTGADQQIDPVSCRQTGTVAMRRHFAAAGLWHVCTICSASTPCCFCAVPLLYHVLQVGGELSLADVSVLCAVQPLLSSVLSAEARQPYPALLAWLQACSSNSTISTVLGERGGGGGWRPGAPGGAFRGWRLVEQRGPGGRGEQEGGQESVVCG